MTYQAPAQAPKSKTVELQTAQPETKRDDPQARALFDEVSKAYKALSSYSDQGQFVMAMTADGKPQKQAVPLKVTLVRPNKVDIDTGIVRLTSDGTTLTTSVIPLKRYMAAPAPQRIDIETLREGPIGAALFGGPSGVPMFVLLNLLTAADAVGRDCADRRLVAARRGKRSEIGRSQGRQCGTPDRSGQGRAWCSAHRRSGNQAAVEHRLEDHLRACWRVENVSIEKLGWTSGAVSTEIPKDRSFAFEAPKGFAKVDTLLGGAEEAPANNSKVGKPAPDFTLTLLDGPGKTKTITKAELAGKVVVIDFWATWCGPCLMELPEIQKLIDSYANTKKDVVVVALSQDDEPSDLAQVRKLVEKTLADKKINLTGSPVGTDRPRPEQVCRHGLRGRGIPHARHPRRQGNRPVVARGLQSRSGGAP